jgi:hypothetical protein
MGLLAEPFMTIVSVELTLAPLSKTLELFTPYANDTRAPSREEVCTMPKPLLLLFFCWRE